MKTSSTSALSLSLQDHLSPVGAHEWNSMSTDTDTGWWAHARCNRSERGLYARMDMDGYFSSYSGEKTEDVGGACVRACVFGWGVTQGIDGEAPWAAHCDSVRLWSG